MQYLVWSLLNIGLGIFFIGVCFRAAKLIREHIGLFASIIFVIGLLSFAGNSGNQNDNEGQNDQVRKWAFSSKDVVAPNTINYNRHTIDKKLTLAIDLGVQYGRDTTSMKWVPIEANSSMTGFISGYRWKPQAVSVNSTAAAGKLAYEVVGVLEWNLLGVTLYRQLETYSGIFDIK